MDVLSNKHLTYTNLSIHAMLQVLPDNCNNSILTFILKLTQGKTCELTLLEDKVGFSAQDMDKG